MSIYISYHPIDILFAAKLLAYFKNKGFQLELFPSNCSVLPTLLKNDIVIALLRLQYIKSAVYQSLAEKNSEITILPVLRAPITLDDWNGITILNPEVDFTSHDAGQTASNLDMLGKLLTSYPVVSDTTQVTDKEIQLNLLEEIIQRHCFPLNLLESLNYNCASPGRAPICTLLDSIPFKIFPRDSENSTYRSDYLKNIANHYETYTVICDYLDSQTVTDFMIDIVRRKAAEHDSQTPIPILVNVEDWNGEISLSDWLANERKLGNRSLEAIETRKLIFYVCGFERSSLKVHQFTEIFREWQRETSPPLALVLVCSQLDELASKSLTENIIKPVKYNFELMKALCSKYLNRPFARFLLSCSENSGNLSQLAYLLNNPTFTASLLSLHFEADEEFSKLSIGDYFERFINSLWKAGDDKNKTDFSQVKDALLKIAAVVTERQKPFVTYKEALNFIQSEVLLGKCIEVGLFNLINNEVRFSISVIQNYFAAAALVEYGVPSQLPHLTLTEQSNRKSQRWDQAVIIASHFASTPDTFVMQIADIDPLLALQCITSGISVSSSLYSYVIDKNLEALVNLGDFRISFAKLLYVSDPVTAKAILVEVLRNARWSIRLYAYSMFQELDTASMPGLIESLTDINEHTRVKVSQAIRRIGLDAFSTLFQLLHHDNATIRLNAIWAISELKDRVFVPALVKMLWDNNVAVSVQAAITLGTILDIDAVPYLAKHLQHRHPRIRKAVISSLLEIQSKQPDAFIDIIRGMDAATRRLVVVYLSTSQTSMHSDFLLVFSHDENVDVRIAALEGLATSNDPRVISRLEECLEDMSKSQLSKSSVSEFVSRILSTIPKHEDGKGKSLNSSQIVKARLLNAKEQHPNIKVSNSDDKLGTQSGRQNKEEMSQRQPPEDAYVADILSQLRVRKWDTSNNAAKILRDYIKGLQGNTSLNVVNQILETLNDRDWVIRWTGVETLGWVGNVHVVPHLIQRLEDSNWKVRVAAVRALAEIKDNSAVDGLSTRISDDNSVVREAAAEALGFLEGKQVINALETAASDPEDFVRLAAVESLGKTHEMVAARVLVFALKDSSEHVRWAAANSLLEITDPSLVPLLIPSLLDTAGPYWEQKRICDVIVDILKQIGTEEAKHALLEWQNNSV